MQRLIDTVLLWGFSHLLKIEQNDIRPVPDTLPDTRPDTVPDTRPQPLASVVATLTDVVGVIVQRTLLSGPALLSPPTLLSVSSIAAVVIVVVVVVVVVVRVRSRCVIDGQREVTVLRVGSRV